jgi:hypothetical protein
VTNRIVITIAGSGKADDWHPERKNGDTALFAFQVGWTEGAVDLQQRTGSSY